MYYRFFLFFFFMTVAVVSGQDQSRLLSKEEAVNMVLKNNFGVKIAQNNIEIAENNKGLLNSGYLPTLSGSAGADYARSNINTEFPGQSLTDDDGNPIFGTDGEPVARPDFVLNQAESQRYNASLNFGLHAF